MNGLSDGSFLVHWSTASIAPHFEAASWFWRHSQHKFPETMFLFSFCLNFYQYKSPQLVWSLLFFVVLLQTNSSIRKYSTKVTIASSANSTFFFHFPNSSTSRTTAFLGLIGLIGLSGGKIGGFLCLSSVSSTISASKAWKFQYSHRFLKKFPPLRQFLSQVPALLISYKAAHWIPSFAPRH